MQFILILQWPVDTPADYETLIAMEETLEGRLNAERCIVDGHDIGRTEMNIFLETDVPYETFEDAASALTAYSHWSNVRAAFRSSGGDSYEIIWPAGLQHFSVS